MPLGAGDVFAMWLKDWVEIPVPQVVANQYKTCSTVGHSPSLHFAQSDVPIHIHSESRVNKKAQNNLKHTSALK